MTPEQTARVVRHAAALPPAKARRVVGAILAAAAPPAPPAFTAALSADVRPLGDALMQAYASSDLPAMQAALRQLSARMPDFLSTATLAPELLASFQSALLAT